MGISEVREWIHGFFCTDECKLCAALNKMNNTIQRHVTQQEKLKQKLKEKREKNGTENKSI